MWREISTELGGSCPPMQLAGCPAGAVAVKEVVGRDTILSHHDVSTKYTHFGIMIRRSRILYHGRCRSRDSYSHQRRTAGEARRATTEHPAPSRPHPSRTHRA